MPSHEVHSSVQGTLLQAKVRIRKHSVFTVATAIAVQMKLLLGNIYFIGILIVDKKTGEDNKRSSPYRFASDVVNRNKLSH